MFLLVREITGDVRGAVDFCDGKLCNERICWDEASVLVQVGLLDPRGLPAHGARS